MGKVVSRVCTVAAIVWLVAPQLAAQVTGGYWGNQYGSRGLLLNGAVIASCDDEAAIFYNPAGLGLTDDFGVAVSLITPTFNYVRTNDLIGDGNQFIDQGLGLAPGLIAAKFQPFKSKKINAGVTIFKRFESEVNYDGRVVSNVEGEEDVIFVGDLEYSKDVSETWVGLGFSFALHERLSIGFTEFITWRGEEVDLNFQKEFVDRSNSDEIVLGWRSRFRYGYGANGGVLTKVGLSWRPWNMKVGVTYTSRTYGLALRSADYKYNDIKVRSVGGSELRSNDRSTELLQYKTPASVGFGLEFLAGKSRLSFSAEYFEGISPYTIIDEEDDPLDGLGTAVELERTTIRQGNNAVLNVAFGMERILNEKYSWFLSGRTDFSPQSLLDVDQNISFLATDPDIFHIAIGSAYTFRKSKFSAGIDYGLGVKTGGQQLIDLSNVTAENIFTFDGKNNVETFSHSFALFITYDL